MNETIERLENIAPGESVVYYTGVTPTTQLEGSELDKIMKAARKLSNLEKAVLFQRKISTHEATPSQPTRFEYIAKGLEW